MHTLNPTPRPLHDNGLRPADGARQEAWTAKLPRPRSADGEVLQDGAVAAVLGALSQPAALIDERGVVLCLNPQGRSALDASNLVALQNERIVLRASASPIDGAFLRGRRYIWSDQEEGQERLSLVLRCPRTNELLVIEASCLVDAVLDPRLTRWLLVIHSDPRVYPFGGGAVRAFFGLTPTEVRVVERLVRGEKPSELALHMGISQETVRKHLGNLFRKCHVGSQTQLVQIFSRFF